MGPVQGRQDRSARRVCDQLRHHALRHSRAERPFTNPPLINSVNISNPSLDNPAAGTPSVSAAPVSLRGIPFDTNTPYVQQFSLTQRELFKGMIVDVGYFGSKGTHLLGIVDLNLVPPGWRPLTE